mmetsp:Transcript_1726/g.3846  ORF Transcript_1726/g.3846 Transcript_1726/m.3846 type:complete len:209 (+) Transcript_1726:218-844(+)
MNSAGMLGDAGGSEGKLRRTSRCSMRAGRLRRQRASSGFRFCSRNWRTPTSATTGVRAASAAFLVASASGDSAAIAAIIAWLALQSFSSALYSTGAMSTHTIPATRSACSKEVAITAFPPSEWPQSTACEHPALSSKRARSAAIAGKEQSLTHGLEPWLRRSGRITMRPVASAHRRATVEKFEQEPKRPCSRTSGGASIVAVDGSTIR